MNVYAKIMEYAATGRTAIRYRGETRSYAEVCRAMRSLGGYLRERYGTDDTPILLYGHKEIDMIPCMLGCSLAGHPYVPIDTAFPQSRLQMVMEDVKPRLLIDFTGEIEPDGCDVLHGEQIAEILAGSAGEDESVVFPAEESVCYILFTSGSTGRPKGVEIRFSNLHAYLKDFCPIFYAGEGAHVVLNSLSYSFDVSAGYIYPSLYYGYTLHSVDKGMLEHLGALFEDLKTAGIGTVMSTPSVMELCAASAGFGRNVLPDVERFIFCGEVLTNELARTLKTRFGGAAVVNTYGPTEATILVTAVTVTDGMIQAERPLPIGRPLPGTVLRVADDRGAPLPPGERGQLQILGPQCGPGYFRRPDLTAQAFFEDAATGLRGYNTGDICYFDGEEYYFCHRNDFQVKLNGYRIELGDIENNLTNIPYVSRAAVLPVYEGRKASYLAAFVVLSEGAEASPVKQRIAIKKDLGKLVAGYMVPRKIIVKSGFPMNANGKTDRKALEAELR